MQSTTHMKGCVRKGIQKSGFPVSQISSHWESTFSSALPPHPCFKGTDLSDGRHGHHKGMLIF